MYLESDLKSQNYYEKEINMFSMLDFFMFVCFFFLFYAKTNETEYL